MVERETPQEKKVPKKRRPKSDADIFRVPTKSESGSGGNGVTAFPEQPQPGETWSRKFQRASEYPERHSSDYRNSRWPDTDANGRSDEN